MVRLPSVVRPLFSLLYFHAQSEPTHGLFWVGIATCSNQGFISWLWVTSLLDQIQGQSVQEIKIHRGP